MSFIVPDRAASATSTPEGVFRGLNRASGGPQHLWAHQADLLRAYNKHVNAPDIAIELPTGAGKTLVGMLIGEWRRRRGERILYLCPTRQLARQAAADAARVGIRTVDLTGRYRSWNEADALTYRRGEAIAVAAYHAVFNSHPHLSDAHALIFDDAHAAGGPILDAWTVNFDRSSPGYQWVLQLCAAGLDPAVAARLRAGSEDPHESRASYLIDPRVVAEQEDQLRPILSQAVAGTDESYPWTTIRDSLSACSVFIAADQLQIRPVLPPTAGHSAYNDPRQRIYLSATLGDGGELERAFGRPNITRLPIPTGWDERGTGRRFFLFPQLTKDFARGDDAVVQIELDAYVRGIVRAAGRALLLAPSNRMLTDITGRYVPQGVPVVDANDIGDSLAPFTAQNPSVLALANRYDGIDLPDAACRLIVMAGLPIGADAHERFLAFTLGAKRVLQERMRTRLVQGSGRATRNANDWAAVIILGRELVSFAAMSDAQAATHPEVRAELEFGIANSQGQDAATLHRNLTHFLAQDETWRNNAEPAISALREINTDIGRADSSALTASARHEIAAVQSAWRGDWARAVTSAQRAIDALSGGSELRPYQALWNYLAGYWASRAASTDPAFAAVARRLSSAAYAAAARTTWIPRRTDLMLPVEPTGPAEVDVLAAQAIIKFAHEIGSSRTMLRMLDTVTTDIHSQPAATYERGLVELGRLLGAASAKPPGDARADALWRWGDQLWIAWEAKSAQIAEHPVDASSIRQANTHLRAAADDLDTTIPPGSITVLSTPRTQLDRTVIPLAEAHLAIVDLVQVEELADRVVAMWQELRSRLISDGDEEALLASVLVAFAEHDVAPSTLASQLSGRLL
jgi:hypothetical protein